MNGLQPQVEALDHATDHLWKRLLLNPSQTRTPLTEISWVTGVPSSGGTLLWGNRVLRDEFSGGASTDFSGATSGDSPERSRSSRDQSTVDRSRSSRDQSTVDRSIRDQSTVDRSIRDQSTVDRSIRDQSTVDRSRSIRDQSTVDRSRSIRDRSTVDRSRSIRDRSTVDRSRSIRDRSTVDMRREAGPLRGRGYEHFHTHTARPPPKNM
ncbi:hypothetical protein EYF80_062195 [Liparis tanakae]|uniref:Uncharacterized protein n=1 Tax=Liparis tanakae TaxID=230148 RepID=A0A4Z2EGK0_9TELE|nr:hypothetical protein EYF80_062195 [Liparis tanakae]